MKTNLRRITVILAVILAIGTLTACGNKENGTEGTVPNGTQNETVNNTEDGVSDETTQNETKPNDSVEEIVVGKAITTVEDGCTYYVAETDTTLEAGTEIPAPKEGDKYKTIDYVYTYGFKIGDKKISEWNVRAKDKTKESYDEILYSIAGNKLLYMYRTFENCENLIESPTIPSGITTLYWTYFKCINMTTAPTIPNNVTDMYGTFSNCKKLAETPVIPNGVTRMYRTFCACESLTTAPVIPDSVTNMEETFYACTNLVNAPVIPENVTNMHATFDDCTSLTAAPVIPKSVTNMKATFSSCTGLTGAIEINANPNMYDYCFMGVNFVEQNLTLTGSSEKLEKLIATGKQ